LIEIGSRSSPHIEHIFAHRHQHHQRNCTITGRSLDSIGLLISKECAEIHWARNDEQAFQATFTPSFMTYLSSPDGHDGFLLESERINGCLVGFLRSFRRYVGTEGRAEGAEGGFDVKKTGVLGVAEADVAL